MDYSKHCRTRYAVSVIIILFLLFTLFLIWNTLVHLRSTDFARTPVDYNASINQREKVKRISFLKVPKTGSSTIACIFLRFGMNNNLSIYWQRDSIVPESYQKVLLKKNKQYDIYVTHTHYSHKFFTGIVRNPVIIGSLRRPEERIISHAFYSELQKFYKNLGMLNRQNFINEIVKDTARYAMNNVISLYFGIKDKKIPDAALKQYLSRLNSEFTLVLILERIDESLVLLKRLLGWTVFDIISAAKKSRQNNDIHLNSSQIRHLESTNKLKYSIYEFFYEELERKIKKAGDDFVQEVDYFKDILKQTDEFCHLLNNTMPFYSFPASKWGYSFSITTKDCYLIYEPDVTDFKKRYFDGQKEKNL